MKKLLYLMPMTLLIGSCSADEPMFQISEEVGAISENPVSPYRTIDEILAIAAGATDFLADNGRASQTDSRGIGRAVDFRTPVYSVTNARSRSEVADTLLHVVNFTDSNGYAIIAASRNFPALLAVTERGHFNPEAEIENPGFSIWYDDVVSTLSSNDIRDIDTLGIYNPIPVTKPKTVRDTVWHINIDPRLQVKWGQNTLAGACEGLECPNGRTGCAITAAVMCMSYLEQPTKINITYGPPYDELYLDWKELKKYAPASNPFYFYPQSDYPIRDVLSRLCREIGHEAKSEYLFRETATDKMNLVACLQDLGLKTGNNFSRYPAWFFKLYPTCIIIEKGKNTKSISGHMWVCDGIKQFQNRERYYESSDGGITWKLKDTTLGPVTTYLSYNWGWRGTDDGYFIDGLLPLNDPNDTEERYPENRSSLPLIK